MFRGVGVGIELWVGETRECELYYTVAPKKKNGFYFVALSYDCQTHASWSTFIQNYTSNFVIICLFVFKLLE